MDRDQMQLRLKRFSLRIMSLVEALPETKTGHAIGKQLVRSGTSVGANYRAACRARSTADFIAKLAIAEEEADETVYWLDLLIEGKVLPARRLQPLLQESNELLAILSASRITAKRRRSNGK